MKTVALIGMGAIGAFFAPRFLKHMEQGSFCVIAGGERKRRLETEGMTINGEHYALPVCAPEDGQPVDLVIIAVKSMALRQAIEDIRLFVGERTQILCVLNGVGSEEQVAAAYGWEHVLYSFMRVSSVRQGSDVRYRPDLGAVMFGEAKNDNDAPSPRVEEIQAFFTQVEVPYRTSRDMVNAMWLKYACNIGENLTCALLGVPFGAFTKSESANWLRVNAMKEVQAVAKARGIHLADEKLEKQLETLQKLPFGNMPSTLQDLRAGKKTELDMLAGEMVRMGKETGIPTPLCECFWHGITVLEEKNDGWFEPPV